MFSAIETKFLPPALDLFQVHHVTARAPDLLLVLRDLPHLGTARHCDIALVASELLSLTIGVQELETSLKGGVKVPAESHAKLAAFVTDANGEIGILERVTN